MLPDSPEVRRSNLFWWAVFFAGYIAAPLAWHRVLPVLAPLYVPPSPGVFVLLLSAVTGALVLTLPSLFPRYARWMYIVYAGIFIVWQVSSAIRLGESPYRSEGELGLLLSYFFIALLLSAGFLALVLSVPRILQRLVVIKNMRIIILLSAIVIPTSLFTAVANAQHIVSFVNRFQILEDQEVTNAKNSCQIIQVARLDSKKLALCLSDGSIKLTSNTETIPFPPGPRAPLRICSEIVGHNLAYDENEYEMLLRMQIDCPQSAAISRADPTPCEKIGHVGERLRCVQDAEQIRAARRERGSSPSPLGNP